MCWTRRLGKELANYKQEETSFKAKVEQMEHSGADEYDIKQQVCRVCLRGTDDAAHLVLARSNECTPSQRE